jgi:RNA polymerase sigma-54 factor
MRFDTSQHMKLGQQMKLAPRMIQSMEILQLPMTALEERIAQEMEKNPALELLPPADSAVAPAAGLTEDAARLPPRDDKAKREDFREQVGRLERVEDFYDDRNSYSGIRRGDGERDRKLDAMANTAAPEESLNDHLHRQLGEETLDDRPAVKKAAAAVIDVLEESGFLKTPLEQLVAAIEGVTPADFEEALRLVQGFDPAGVGARDLRECLLLQLDRLEGDHPTARKLVTDHLDDLAANRLPAIVRQTGLTIAQIDEGLKTIRRLQPRPGSGFGGRPVPFVIPDVIIEWDEDTESYSVQLADGNFPNLGISEACRGMLKRGLPDAKSKEFLQNNIRSAQWLIAGIEQRRHTLLRVARTVVEYQADYIRYGRSALRPLPMTQVAAELGIHVGTVSRAVHDKHVQTPRGILPLRSFFTGGTQNAEGEDVAWEAVRAKLADIIKNENKADPLSDGDIVRKLKEQGLDLARRTVAKYRKILSIPPARQRRVYTDASVAAEAAALDRDEGSTDSGEMAVIVQASPEPGAEPADGEPADPSADESTADFRAVRPPVVPAERTPPARPPDTPRSPPRMVVIETEKPRPERPAEPAESK